MKRNNAAGLRKPASEAGLPWLLAVRGALICACVGLAACQPRQPLEIPFEARLGDLPLSCTAFVDETALTDLRFYVHDVQLVKAGGEEAALQLEPDGSWQSEEVAFLDFESGEGDCVNGTPAVNTVIRGTAPPGDYVGLRFRLGVPEHLNHADPLRAEPPLNDSLMHWHWRTGYKFLRAGVSSRVDGFWLHLGSTRCEGSSSNLTGCRSPNRPIVALPAVPATGQVVVVDLAELTRGTDMEDGTPSDCSSGPAEKACRSPFEALGLDFDSGGATAAASMFRIGDAR